MSFLAWNGLRWTKERTKMRWGVKKVKKMTSQAKPEIKSRRHVKSERERGREGKTRKYEIDMEMFRLRSISLAYVPVSFDPNASACSMSQLGIVCLQMYTYAICMLNDMPSKSMITPIWSIMMMMAMILRWIEVFVCLLLSVYNTAISSPTAP